MIYLELVDVLAIACEVLDLDAATLVFTTSLDLADSAVARPAGSFAGQEFYPTVEAKAAALLFSLAKNHAFVNGNKRVALLSTLQFLNTNGYDLELQPVEDAFNTVVRVAAGELSLEDLTTTIRDLIRAP